VGASPQGYQAKLQLCSTSAPQTTKLLLLLLLLL
jgi:hypothetical protein